MGKTTLPLLVALLLLACGRQEDHTAVGAAAKPAAPKAQTAAPLPGMADMPVGVVAPREEPTPLPYNPPPVDNGVTVTVAPVKASRIPTDERERLEQEAGKIESSMQSVIKQYDRNLDNPERRKELESKLRGESAAYSGKVLSLVKDKLKQEKPAP